MIQHQGWLARLRAAVYVAVAAALSSGATSVAWAATVDPRDLVAAERAYRAHANSLDQNNAAKDAEAIGAALRYASLLRAVGRQADVVPIYRRVLAALRRAGVSAQRDSQTLVTNLAFVHIELRQWAVAQPLLVEALAAARAATERDDRALGALLHQSATVARELGDAASAIALFAEAVKVRGAAQGADHVETLASRRAVLELQARDVDPYVLAAQHAELAAAHVRTLGSTDPDALRARAAHGIALLDSGDARAASALLDAVLRDAEQALGMEHVVTLSLLHNLGHALVQDGRHRSAIPLLERCLGQRTQLLGERHAATLATANVLGLALLDARELDRARTMFERAASGRARVLGEQHLATLTTLASLAIVDIREGRLAAARERLERVVAGRTAQLGSSHPATLAARSQLAELLARQDELGSAATLARSTYEAQRATLGATHPQTLRSMRRLAKVLDSIGAYDEALALLEQALLAQQSTLGSGHPETLASTNDLAVQVHARGQFDAARQLFGSLVERATSSLGADHPDTHEYIANRLQFQIGDGDAEAAVATVLALEQAIGARAEYDAQFAASTERMASLRSVARHDIVDLAIELALQFPDQATVAAIGVLARNKYLGAEIEAVVARAGSITTDPETAEIARRLIEYRSVVAGVLQDSARVPADELQRVLAEIDRSEVALMQRSGALREARRVAASMSTERIGASLPRDAVLIDFRRYRSLRATTGGRGGVRFAAAIVSGDGEPPRVVDLGAVANIEALVDVLDTSDDELADIEHQHEHDAARADAARALYLRLFGADDVRLARFRHVFIAPDGPLHRVPFAALLLGDGRYWVQRQALHRLQTSRDLLAPAQPTRQVGVLAVGGANYDAEIAAPPSAVGAGSAVANLLAERVVAPTRRFGELSQSEPEARGVAAIWQRHGLPATALVGNAATERALQERSVMPDVLHLATHGFFARSAEAQRYPLAASGIAFAGANRARHSGRDDGVLYASEALGLRLDGVRLVVLSACETARGVEHAVEGSLGLVRALRAAGARDVLSTLWPVDDWRTREFMEEFHEALLTSAAGDASQALATVQARWASAPADDERSRPEHWAPFVLVERRTRSTREPAHDALVGPSHGSRPNVVAP